MKWKLSSTCLVIVLLSSPGSAFGDLRASYSRYSLSNDEVDTCYPKIPGREGWFGLWATGADAALRHPTNGKVYFFDGAEYVRYNLQTDRVDPGYPKRVGKDGWFGLWSDGVDAAVIHPTNGKAYFFKGSKYARYNFETDQVDPGYPKNIDSEGWFGLWKSGVDAAVLHPTNGKVYFFKGDRYARYNFETDQVDPGYPKAIGGGGWFGLRSPVNAAVALDAERVYFFHPATEAEQLTKLAVFNQPDGKGSQDDHLHATLMKLIREAKPCSRISISIAGWDRPEFADALADAAARGVDVRVVGQVTCTGCWFGIKNTVQQRLAHHGLTSKDRGKK